MPGRAGLTKLIPGDSDRPHAPAHLPDDHQQPLTIKIDAAPERTLVMVSGVADTASEHALRDGLRGALIQSAHGIDLDLSNVQFCDGSGLYVLLGTQRRALDEGKSISLQACSPAVHRILLSTGTLPLFTTSGQHNGPGQTPDTHDEDHGHEPASSDVADRALADTGQAEQIELVQLRRAMKTRPVIDLARGVLMASFGLSPEDAWSVLVSVSQNTNTKLHEVADDLVRSVTEQALPSPIRQQVAASVAELQKK
ncbi:ANTAR domain-containing protein [Streptomyces sp. NPDC005463]|uniref:ANTAR domain-containing protein n=1 Tax=Streptomyces sp. NPDC005463 TaxID=3154465 RepID=UPI0033AE8D29